MHGECMRIAFQLGNSCTSNAFDPCMHNALQMEPLCQFNSWSPYAHWSHVRLGVMNRITCGRKNYLTVFNRMHKIRIAIGVFLCMYLLCFSLLCTSSATKKLTVWNCRIQIGTRSDAMPADGNTGRKCTLHIQSSLLTSFLCFNVLFYSCCSRAQVFGKILVNEFHISFSYTEWILLSLLSENVD